MPRACPTALLASPAICHRKSGSERTMTERIAFIGYGEAGQHIARGLMAEGKVRISAYDLRWNERQLRDAAREAKVELKSELAPALEGAALVFSLVTASSAIDAARAAAGHLRAGQTYVDFNSVSPMTKRTVAEAVAGAGADFVEAAIMAPVPGPNHRVPVLLSGPKSAALAPRLNALGMRTEPVGERIGDASLNKMLRSIFIKGFEALLLEGLVAARHVGLESKILDSVQRTIPGVNWREAASYYLERTAKHGARRAAEMHESAATVAELGLDPILTSAIAKRIEWAHQQLKDVRWPEGGPKSYEEVLAVIEAKFFNKREAAE
jgi:3-hydroxyisobutyrate dehydrogenase-like beta-hydroxyacid dehydrogenase